MLASGALWMAGGLVVASGVVSTRRLTIAFVLIASPWLAGVCESTPDHATWLGALVLLAGVLWFSSAVLTIPLGVVTALLSVAIAQAVGPHTRWFGLGGQPTKGTPFSSLDTEPTYGPLTDRRTGAPMVAVTAAGPAMWRMQTLDYFAGGGWTTGPDARPELPQPAARREEIVVRVLGLRQDLVVAPGRVDRVDPRGSVAGTGGEAWRLAAVPRTGDTYRVVASSLRVSADRLAGDHAPLDRRARAYTRLGFTTQPESAVSLLAWVFGSLGLRVRAPTNPVVDPRVVALARRLAVGASTEWGKVVRVERFLLASGRFRYTTQVPAAGAQPIVDFLLRTHAGYCQHFAGAAALLLRLAGVPARVVAGFATGRQTGPHQYTVRDLDAHDWIEVYFPGDGWVPFNPTPFASPATIAGGLDPLRLPTPPARGAVDLPVSLLCVLVAGAGLVLVGLRARRLPRRPPELLERVARNTAGPVDPSTTFAQLGIVMARIGPRTAAIAAETERARFAAGPSVAPRYPRMRLARALVRDVGILRALLISAPLPRRIRRWSGVVTPTPEEWQDEQRHQ
jgi:transglutaminase-like putative cysteine protease